MTIYELERRSGISRPNIRFYEKEGLIAPRRQANGYRDYSEEDAILLEKIALLRRLDMPLEAIRSVIGGEVPLSLALERQQELLAEQRNRNEQAYVLCGTLRAQGVTFAQMEPGRYQAVLASGQNAVPELPGGPEKTAEGCFWRRFLAYDLDGTLYGMLWYLLELFLLRMCRSGILWTVVSWVAGLLCVLLLESLLLCTVGTTPGKWLLGLELRYLTSQGIRKPTFGEAFLRTLGKLAVGCGLMIPPVSWICMFFSFLRAYRWKDQPWDGCYSYVLREHNPGWQKALWALCLAALVAVQPVLEKAADEPRHTGTVDLEEYRANVRDMLAFQYNCKGVTLTAEGQWESYAPNTLGSYIVSANPRVDHAQKIHVENGVVTGVTMSHRLPTDVDESKRYPDLYTGDGVFYKRASVHALVSALPEVTFAQTEEALDTIFDDGEGQVILGPWVITQRVEAEDGAFRNYYAYDADSWAITDKTIALSSAPSVIFTIERKEIAKTP